MPKKADRNDNQLPRRGRAVAIDAEDERGLAMRLLLHSPKDLVAAMFASAAVIAIITNALFMQAGRHPSPMFGSSLVAPSAAPVNPLPRPRPADAAGRLAEPRPNELKAAERAQDGKPVDGRAVDLFASPTKTTAPVSTAPPVAAAAAAAAPAAPRPPAPVPAATRSDPLGDLITSSRRVAQVQRALTEYGYGQLKPSGTVGSDTQAAIQKFERDRKIPVTGQISDRLVRELSAMTGRPIE
ncbi:MAG TPA: peptidoglycan-binding domain-containing protein [Rhodopseudomonas sp.]|uniref:peptidoglycan-binding domain-containing protein n=1 Tax=Rhodopseudomonas sp. TaxID=1078 RepID=UPI002EDAEA21